MTLLEQQLLKVLGLDKSKVTKLVITLEAQKHPIIEVSMIIFDGNLSLLNKETGLLGTSTTKYKLVEVDEDEACK